MKDSQRRAMFAKFSRVQGKIHHVNEFRNSDHPEKDKNPRYVVFVKEEGYSTPRPFFKRNEYTAKGIKQHNKYIVYKGDRYYG